MKTGISQKDIEKRFPIHSSDGVTTGTSIFGLSPIDQITEYINSHSFECVDHTGDVVDKNDLLTFIKSL